MIPLRLGERAAATGKRELIPLDPATGYYGSLETWRFEPVAKAERPVAKAERPRVPMAWLPTERVANAWRNVRRGEPFDRPTGAAGFER